MFIYLWETQREHEQGRGRERGRQESEAGSRLWVVSTEPDAGLELTNREIMTRAEVGRLTDWATLAPWFFFLICFFALGFKSIFGDQFKKFTMFTLLANSKGEFYIWNGHPEGHLGGSVG